VCTAAAALPRYEAGRASIVVGSDTGAPFLADHYGVSLAVLDDGRFAVSGTTTVAAPDPSQQYPQFETAAYSPLGQRLATFVPQPPADMGSIGSLGKQYFVTWQHFVEGRTRAARLDGKGMQEGPSVGWPNSNVEFYYQYYRYGSGPLWRFVPITYRTDGIDPLFGTPILIPLIQPYAPTGVPLGPALRLAPDDERIFVHDSAMSGSGHFVVLFQHCAGGPSVPCPIGLQVFEGAGEPEGSFSSLGIPQFVAGDVTVAIQDTGQVLIAWVNLLANGQTRLLVRLFSFQGVPLSRPLSVVESRLILQEGLRAIDNGQYVVTWANAEAVGLESFFAAVCESPSLSCSTPVTIARHQQVASGFQFEMNHSGRGLATWATYDSAGTFTGHLATVNVGGEVAADGN
jgi:hypothetical protein